MGKEAAKKLFKTKEGKTQLKDISRKAKTFTPGDALPEATNKTTNSAGLTPEQVRSLKTAIAKASSLDEIERLNQMLRSGTMPGMKPKEGMNGKKWRQSEDQAFMSFLCVRCFEAACPERASEKQCNSCP